MRHSLSDLSPRQTWLLILLVIAALLAGLGLREPMPADEPRFVLAAKTMVETSQWLFPQRGIELYAEKPPTFMWLQAGLAGVQGGHLFFLGGRCLTVLAPLGQSLLNLPATLAEILKLFLGKALYLEAPIRLCALDFIPQRRQVPSQLGAVVGAGIFDVA